MNPAWTNPSCPRASCLSRSPSGRAPHTRLSTSSGLDGDSGQACSARVGHGPAPLRAPVGTGGGGRMRGWSPPVADAALLTASTRETWKTNPTVNRRGAECRQHARVRSARSSRVRRHARVPARSPGTPPALPPPPRTQIQTIQTAAASGLRKVVPRGRSFRGFPFRQGPECRARTSASEEPCIPPTPGCLSPPGSLRLARSQSRPLGSGLRWRRPRRALRRPDWPSTSAPSGAGRPTGTSRSRRRHRRVPALGLRPVGKLLCQQVGEARDPLPGPSGHADSRKQTRPRASATPSAPPLGSSRPRATLQPPSGSAASSLERQGLPGAGGRK